MLAERKFPARPGEHCARCPFVHICPDAGRVELDDLQTPDDLGF
jgi:hypothetical protein